MNRSRAKELVPVLQAWSEGRQIQVGIPGQLWETYDGECPNFENDNWLWRVKPTERDFWIVLRFDGQIVRAFKSQKEAVDLFLQGKTIVHAREVIDEGFPELRR